MVCGWRHNAQNASMMHRRAAAYYHSKHMKYSVPTTIIHAIIGGFSLVSIVDSTGDTRSDSEARFIVFSAVLLWVLTLVHTAMERTLASMKYTANSSAHKQRSMDFTDLASKCQRVLIELDENESRSSTRQPMLQLIGLKEDLMQTDTIATFPKEMERESLRLYGSETWVPLYSEDTVILPDAPPAMHDRGLSVLADAAVAETEIHVRTEVVDDDDDDDTRTHGSDVSLTYRDDFFHKSLRQATTSIKNDIIPLRLRLQRYDKFHKRIQITKLVLERIRVVAASVFGADVAVTSGESKGNLEFFSALVMGIITFLLYVADGLLYVFTVEVTLNTVAKSISDLQRFATRINREVLKDNRDSSTRRKILLSLLLRKEELMSNGVSISEDVLDIVNVRETERGRKVARQSVTAPDDIV